MLYKFKCAVARFMYGRNGMDQLNMALFTAYIALWLVQMIMASVLKSQIFAAIMEIVVTALCVIVLFRMFSKNLPCFKGFRSSTCNKQILNRHFSVKLNHHLIIETISLYY